MFAQTKFEVPRVTITEVIVLRGLPLLSKKKVIPKIYRSYPIKGRTPLIETQKNVRNKSTIPVLARVTLALIQTNYREIYFSRECAFLP